MSRLATKRAVRNTVKRTRFVAAGKPQVAKKVRRSIATLRWETQAEGIADAFTNGKQDLKRFLTPAPAAFREVGASVGYGLPGPLQARFEQAFGARLGAVRIHTGTPAAQIARQEGAAAFTAGRNIFFRDGFWNPNTLSGVRLLAHEISHVLQQTGRASSTGLLEVRDIAGRGEIQRRDYPRPVPDMVVTDDLAKKYEPFVTAADRQKFKEIANDVYLRVGATLGASNSNIKWLTDRIDKGEFDKPDKDSKFRPFLCDVLRVCKQGKAAGYLLSLDPTMPSLYHLPEASDEVQTRLGPAWADQYLALDPLKSYFPFQYIDTYRRYLFGPTRKLQSLWAPPDDFFGDYQKFFKEYEHAQKIIDEPSVNELGIDTFEKLRQIDEIRLKNLESVRDQLVKDNPKIPEEVLRLFMARKLARGYLPEGNLMDSPALAAAAGQIPAIAKQAEAFWDQAINGEASPEWKKVRDETAKGKPGARLRKELAELAGQVLVRNKKGELPSPSEYNDRIQKAQKRLHDFAFHEAEEKVIDLSRHKWDAGMGVWYGYIYRLAYQIRLTLGAYDFAADRKFISNLPDVRVAHRIRFAKKLLEIARTFQWKELEDQLSPVIEGKEKGLIQNQFALVGDWQEDESASWADLNREGKGAGEITGFAGINANDLVNLFSIEYHDNYTKEILQILEGRPGVPGEEGDFSTKREPIFPRASRALLAGPFRGPRRYVLDRRDYELTLGFDNPTFSELIRTHPKTKRKLAALEAGELFSADRSVAMVPNEYLGQPSIWFWTIPPLKPLYDRLRQVRATDGKITLSLDELVRAQMQRVAPIKPESPSSAPEPDWVTWLKVFTTLPKHLSKEQMKLIHDKIEIDLRSGAENAKQKFEAAARRASIQDRKLLVKWALRPALADFGATTRTSSNLRDAFDELLNFGSRVMPFADHEKHWAAMVIELFQPPKEDEADLVKNVKRYIRSYVDIMAWQGLLRWTIRKAEDPAAALEDVFTAEEKKDTGRVKATVPRMQELVKALEEEKQESQMKYGFKGERTEAIRRDTTLDTFFGSTIGTAMMGPETTIKPDRLVDYKSGHELEKNHPFQIDGVNWMLMSVIRPFEFHGGYGSVLNPDNYTPPILKVDGQEVPVDAKTLRRVSSRDLLQVKRAGQVITIREADDDLLEELSQAVTLRSNVEDLETLEKILNKGAELFLDGAEFVPFYGQVAMAARLAQAIIAFVFSGEFEEIKKQVFEDPLGTLEKLASLFKGDLFTVERIADWFLLGNPSLPRELTKDKPTEATPETAPETENKSIVSKFLHLIKRVLLAAWGVYKSLRRVQGRASRGYLELDAFIHTHPALLLVFTIAGNHLELLIEAAKEIGERGLDDIESKESIPGFSEALGNIVATINTIEIPESILPIGEVIDIVLSIVIDHLGGKYKLIGKGVLKLLDEFGQKKTVMDKIGEAVPDKIQPDYYWKNFAKESLDPTFHRFRDGVVEGISGVFTEYLGLPRVEAARVPAVSIHQHGTEFPESETTGGFPAAEKKPAEDPDPDLWDGPLPQPGPGSPLPMRLRSQIESEFGHDFSHVRLHSGDEARPVTGRFQADGVTTGSHVYMRPGLQPDAGRGREVFRHELSHVLQQTGSRPVGGKHSETPKTGEPQRGLQWDPAAETAADRMAERAQNSAAPVEVEAADCQAAQPLLSAGTVARLLRKLSRGEAVAKQRQRLAEGPLQQLPDAVQKQIAPVQSAILACFDQKPLFRMPAAFEEVRKQIGAYATFQLKGKDGGLEIQRAAQEALDQPTLSEAESAEKPEPTLNVRAFRAAVESLLYNIGLVCRIQLKTQSAHGKTTLDSANPVVNITLATLDMPSIRYAQTDAKELWDTMMSQTFPKLKGDELAELRVRVRTYLMGEGPVFGLWNRKKFALSEHVIKDIEKLASEKLAAKDLPSRTNYLADKPAAGATVSPTGWIGLNTGTFDAPEFRSRAAEKPGGQQRRPVEREAHHTTQFLLLKYFRNWRDDDYKPFRHSYKLYPGLETDSMGPKWFDGPKRIEIAKLTGPHKTARGPGMPAISLSKLTHRRGDVHISAQADETEEAEPQAKSAASLVHQQFKDGIPAGNLREAMFDPQPNRLQGFMNVKDNRDEAQKHIFSAMQGTYEWMRKDMMDRLKRGLKLFELPYYNGLLAKGGEEQATDANRLTESDIDNKVMPQAIANNKRIMETESNWSG
jgi:hypothetical protein